MTEALAPIPEHIVGASARAALEEDGSFDDITTRSVVDPAQWGRGVFIAKQHGVVAGLPVAAAAIHAVDAQISFDALAGEGASVAPGTQLAEVEGPVAAILSGERVALNFVQRLSGIATLTREFVDAVVGTSARITDTRKTTPGLRALERYAVRAGGGQNHRFGLASGVLIKDNHIAAAKERGAASIASIVAQARASAPHTMRIEVEVTSIEELEDALEGAPDIVLLDNMSVDEMRRAVETVAGRAIVEASGGVTLENARAIAETGVDLISVGALTHSAPALDISLELSPL